MPFRTFIRWRNLYKAINLSKNRREKKGSKEEKIKDEGTI